MTSEEFFKENENARLMAKGNAAKAEGLRARACSAMARIVGKGGRNVAITSEEHRDIVAFVNELNSLKLKENAIRTLSKFGNS